MIIHGRLQWALAIGVLAFSLAAVVASLLGGGDGSSAATTTTTSSVATTTTTTIPVPLKHMVKSGESLFSIAQLYSVKMEAIIELNNLENPDKLSVGDEILLPQGSIARVAPVTSTSATSTALVTTSTS